MSERDDDLDDERDDDGALTDLFDEEEGGGGDGGSDEDGLQTSFAVSCPFCGEPGEIYVEPDVMGTLVQDCEVCCRPWQVRIGYEDGERYIEVTRGDGE